MNQNNFTVQELKENSSFRRMVRGIASVEEVEYWNEWIESSEVNRQKAKKAISHIIGFEFQSSSLPDIEQEWKRLSKSTIKHERRALSQIHRKKDNSLIWVFRAVAVIVLVSFVGTGAFFFYLQENEVPKLEQLTAERTVTTEGGEQKTLQFSNGSKIILNSFSSVTYSLGNPDNQTIELTLDGEAWFEADTNATSKQPAFEITTPDGIITDIGTKFLVTVQNQQSRVVLQEGVVEVESGNQNQGAGMKIRVESGEMIEFTGSELLKRESVNPTLFTSWATGYMQLEEISIEEFSYYVEQQFDVKVVINDNQMKRISLDGTIYFRSLEELVRSVSELIDVPVSRSEDRKTIYIGSTN